MNPADDDQRRQALDPNGSFLVEAPAGSGKTELLIQRYLCLLARVERPEAVLAMTFTRKAAGELKDRVLSALRDAVAHTPVTGVAAQTRQLAEAALARDRECGWGLLEDSRRLQIQTIDSFCALLVRQMPLLAKLGGPTEVIEYANAHYRAAARRALIELAGSTDHQPAFRRLVLQFDGDLDGLEEKIASMLGKRDQWRRALQKYSADELRTAVEAEVAAAVDDVLARARRLWPSAIPDPPEPVAGQLDRWRTLADEFLVKNTATARKRHPHFAILDAHPDFVRALNKCRTDLPSGITDEQWELIEDYVTVLHLALVQLDQVFREAGKVDFTYISQAAIAALQQSGQPSDLAYWLDYRIEHILVDEFQDTSFAQYELLETLTEQWSDGDNRTLFVVGDPMQSIYRFRNAEVGLFLQAGEHGFRSVQITPLRLSVNFRSTPAIVDWVNHAFTDVMPLHDDVNAGAVALRPSTEARADDGTEPRMHAFISDDGSREAARVAELAAEALNRGSVAILVRARTHLRAIFPALHAANVPYEAVEIDALDGEQHILDLRSLTRALLHPADRLAWLACLRAPWCGLALADLLALAEGDRDATIPDLMADPERFAALSPDGRSRLARFQQVMLPALQNAGRYPLRQMVEGAWIALGGPACLEAEHHRLDAEAYFSLLDGAGESGGIRDLALFDQQLKRLYAKPAAHTGQAVQVMTIHKAKGLQFDTVILPQMHRWTSGTEREFLRWTERIHDGGGEGLLIAARPQSRQTDPLYELVQRTAQEKDELETRRLFYVAATRARDQLHVLGNATLTTKGEVKSARTGSFLKLLWPRAAQVFVTELARISGASATSKPVAVPAPKTTLLRRLPSAWTLPRPEPAVALRPDLRIHPVPPRRVTYEWVSDAARHVGTVVHDLLRLAADEGAEQGIGAWDETRLDAGMRRFASSELIRLGVARSELSSATARVVEAVANTLRSSRGRWILAAHTGAHCEWPLGGYLNGQLQSARIDRTFIDEDGTRWIIDYKTSSHEGGSHEVFLAEERRRYQPQLDTYARLLLVGGEPAVSVGLYFPLLDAWLAWDVEATHAAGE